MRNFSGKRLGGGKKYKFYIQYSFYKNRVFYEIMRKNMIEPDRPHITIEYGVCALHAG
jgi:hypothetical protein